MKKELFVRLAITFFIISFCSACNEMKDQDRESSLLIGIAEVNYTPRVGLDLRGNYRGDDYASRGVHDSLYSRAIVASDEEGEKVAVLAVDICALSSEPVEMMREYIASQTDIKAENIAITASHTHSGPSSDIDAPDARQYLKKAASAVVLANNRLKPTTMFFGRSQEDRISHNRRLKCIDGTTHMCWETFEPGFVEGPLGPIDPDVLTWSFVQDNKEIGSVVNFACHATTLTGNNWLYSADYPGYMVETVRRIKGKEFMPVFFNGPCGNITQVDYKVGFPDTYEECQRIGYMLGVAALEALENEVAVDGGAVAVSKEMVPVKRISISEDQYEWAKKVMKKIEKEGEPPFQADGIPDGVYARKWMQLYKTQNEVDTMEVMVVQIGDVAIVSLPGEFFTEFGMQIKSSSPFKNTLVMGLANDSFGYFPTKISFSQGPEGFTPMITGYETTPGSTRYEIGAGEKLVASVLNQLNKLHDLQSL